MEEGRNSYTYQSKKKFSLWFGMVLHVRWFDLNISDISWGTRRTKREKQKNMEWAAVLFMREAGGGCSRTHSNVEEVYETYNSNNHSWHPWWAEKDLRTCNMSNLVADDSPELDRWRVENRWQVIIYLNCQIGGIISSVHQFFLTKINRKPCGKMCYGLKKPIPKCAIIPYK